MMPWAAEPFGDCGRAALAGRIEVRIDRDAIDVRGHGVGEGRHEADAARCPDAKPR